MVNKADSFNSSQGMVEVNLVNLMEHQAILHQDNHTQQDQHLTLLSQAILQEVKVTQQVLQLLDKVIQVPHLKDRLTLEPHLKDSMVVLLLKDKVMVVIQPQQECQEVILQTAVEPFLTTTCSPHQIFRLDLALVDGLVKHCPKYINVFSCGK